MTFSGQIDPQIVQAKGEVVFGYLGGAIVSGMIFLGDKLGLYRSLQGAGPVTSGQLAEMTGLHERWLREWLRGQAAAGLIDYRDEERFELTAGGRPRACRRRQPGFRNRCF